MKLDLYLRGTNISSAATKKIYFQIIKSSTSSRSLSTPFPDSNPEVPQLATENAKRPAARQELRQESLGPMTFFFLMMERESRKAPLFSSLAGNSTTQFLPGPHRRTYICNNIYDRLHLSFPPSLNSLNSCRLQQLERFLSFSSNSPQHHVLATGSATSRDSKQLPTKWDQFYLERRLGI